MGGIGIFKIEAIMIDIESIISKNTNILLVWIFMFFLTKLRLICYTIHSRSYLEYPRARGRRETSDLKSEVVFYKIGGKYWKNNLKQ